MPKVEIKVEMDSEAPGYGPTAVEIRLDGVDIGGGGIGGESEDNCIVRDYAWVVPALKTLAERLGAEVEIVKTVSDDDA